MSIVLRYVMVVLACMALLLGIQLPNLADQYAKRVDAHLREVTLNFQSYQEIANANTQGSIENLIQLHRKSESLVFQAEASAIESMYQRKLSFEHEKTAMQNNLVLRVGYVLLMSDHETLSETLEQYSATVPLDQGALMMGAVVALATLLLLELLMALLRRLVFMFRRWLSHRWRGA